MAALGHHQTVQTPSGKPSFLRSNRLQLGVMCLDASEKGQNRSCHRNDQAVEQHWRHFIFLLLLSWRWTDSCFWDAAILNALHNNAIIVIHIHT